MNFSEFLARLDNVKGSGDKRTARCPAHADHDNSLSIARGDGGTVLMKCFAGCTVEQICAALSIEVKELFPAQEPKRERKKREAAPPKPLTLAGLAAAKGLPVDWLREQGVDDLPKGKEGFPGVIIAYFLEDGSQHVRIRIRSSLGKDGWSWGGPAGVPVVCYGLWKLAEWRTG